MCGLVVKIISFHLGTTPLEAPMIDWPHSIMYLCTTIGTQKAYRPWPGVHLFESRYSRMKKRGTMYNSLFGRRDEIMQKIYDLGTPRTDFEFRSNQSMFFGKELVAFDNQGVIGCLILEGLGVL